MMMSTTFKLLARLLFEWTEDVHDTMKSQWQGQASGLGMREWAVAGNWSCAALSAAAIM